MKAKPNNVKLMLGAMSLIAPHEASQRAMLSYSAAGNKHYSIITYLTNQTVAMTIFINKTTE
jgi:hypothetical protein